MTTKLLYGLEICVKIIIVSDFECLQRKWYVDGNSNSFLNGMAVYATAALRHYQWPKQRRIKTNEWRLCAGARARSFACNRCKMTRQRIKMFSNFMIFLSLCPRSHSIHLCLRMGFCYEFIIIHQRWHIIPPTIHQIASWIDSSIPCHTISRERARQSKERKKSENCEFHVIFCDYMECMLMWKHLLVVQTPSIQARDAKPFILFVWHNVAVQMHCIHSNVHSNHRTSKALSL